MARFHFTERDYVRACLQLASRRLIWSLLIVAVALILVAGFEVARGESWLTWVPALVIGIPGYAWFIYWVTVRRLKKAFREQDSLREVIDVVIDDVQLSYLWSKGSLILPWQSVRRYKESADFVFLYESRLFAKILPKASLSEEELQVVRRRCREIKKA